jgi:hypothetical protein
MTNLRFSVTTKTALLPSAGYNGTKVTKHTYAYSDLLTIQPRDKVNPPVTGMAHYYKCSETGEIRVWGFDATYGAYKDQGGN